MQHWYEPLRNAHPQIVDDKTVVDIFGCFERFLAVSGRMHRYALPLRPLTDADRATESVSVHYICRSCFMLCV